MTSRELIEQDTRERVIRASNALAQAIAYEREQENKPVMTKKGKTLYHINRERAKTVKMTVNY